MSDSQRSKNTIKTHEYNTIYWSSSISYYKLGSRFKYTKRWGPKDASKDYSEFAKVISLTFSTFSSPKRRFKSLRIPIRCPTLICLDLPLTTLIDITRKRKQFLTCTQETKRAKLERLRLVRLIYSDQKTTTRHAMALNMWRFASWSKHAKISNIFKHVISHLKLMNMWRFASWSKLAKISKQYWLI
jgi:hypothetical protein